MTDSEPEVADDSSSQPTNPALKPILAVGRYFKAVVDFYWSRRTAIREHLLDHVPLYESHRKAQKLIRLYQYQRKPNAVFNEDGWKVRLPDWCIVCANSNCKRIRKRYQLERLRWAIRAPIVVFLLSIPLAVWQFNFWLIPLVSLLGFPLGYSLTRTVDVRLEYYRCAEHRATDDGLPKLRVFGDQLVIQTGHKSIRKKFLDEASDRADDTPI